MPLSPYPLQLSWQRCLPTALCAITLVCALADAAPVNGAGAGINGTDIRADLAANVRQTAMQAYEEQDYDTALPLLMEAHALNPDDAEVAGRLGFSAKENGAYEQALQALETAVELQPDDYYHWWWLSDTQRLLGQYQAALESMERARDLAPAETRTELQNYVAYTATLADDTPSWDNVDQHVAFAERHRNLRRVRRQIEEYVRALNVVPEYAPDDREALARLAWVYQQIGVQYNYIEEPNVAVDYFLMAREFAERAGAPADVMRNEQFLAIANRRQADRDIGAGQQHLHKAAEHWRAALAIAQDTEDVAYQRYTQGRLLETLARLHPLDDEALLALRAKNLKEVPWEGPVNEFSTADAVLGEAEVRMLEGDYAGARILLEMVEPYFADSQYLSDYQRATDVYLALAHAFYQQGHYGESLRHLDKAAEKAAEARKYVDADAFNRSAGEHALRHIAVARARAQIALDLVKNAFDAVEQYKNQHLLNLMGSAIVDDAARTDAASEKVVTRERIHMLEMRLARVEEAGDTAETARIRGRLNTDRARLEWLEREIPFVAPRQLGFKPLDSAGSDALHAILEEDTLFLSYLFDPYGGIATVFAEDGIHGILLEPEEKKVLQHTQTVVAALADTEATPDAMESLQYLHAAIIAPVENMLSRAVLVVSPDTSLDGVPFDALHDGNGWLGDRVAVVYTDTASQLIYQLSREPAPVTRLRVGLGREAADENLCQAISPLDGDCFIGAKATTAALTADVHDEEALHFACRIDLSAPNVMLNPLVLGGTAPDNEVPAATLLAMDIPAAWVTLDWQAQPEQAAVLGDLVRVMGESWRHVGARTLLTTAANLTDDAALLLFKTLYAAMPEKGKTQALQSAKQALREAYPESLAWAGVYLRGDYR